MRENICIGGITVISNEKRLAQVIEGAGLQELIDSIGGMDVQMAGSLAVGSCLAVSGRRTPLPAVCLRIAG